MSAPRPVGPGRAEWIAGLTPARRALIASSDDALVVLAGPCSPEERADALSTVRTALAFVEAWASRSQRALDVERQRGAALAAAVRADCEAREAEGAGGVNTLPVELRAALAAYEGRRA